MYTLISGSTETGFSKIMFISKHVHTLKEKIKDEWNGGCFAEYKHMRDKLEEVVGPADGTYTYRYVSPITNKLVIFAQIQFVDVI